MERPILFNTEMVRAILEGRKTQTRRIVKKKYNNTDIEYMTNKHDSILIEKQNDAPPDIYDPVTKTTTKHVRACAEIKKPYEVGDILYVRETWQNLPDECGDNWLYRADKENTPFAHDDEDNPIFIKWRPSIHMPKKAARIFLRVTDVRAERLQEITNQEAHKEGIKASGYSVNCGHETASNGWDFSVEKFETLWDGTINKKDLNVYGWEADPWVWVIEFERIER